MAAPACYTLALFPGAGQSVPVQAVLGEGGRVRGRAPDSGWALGVEMAGYARACRC